MHDVIVDGNDQFKLIMWCIFIEVSKNKFMQLIIHVLQAD